QRLDGVRPVPAVIAGAVQEHDAATIRRPGGRYVHVRNPYRLPVQVHLEELDGVGVLDLLEVDRDRSPLRGRGGGWLGGLARQVAGEADQPNEEGTGHDRQRAVAACSSGSVQGIHSLHLWPVGRCDRRTGGFGLPPLGKCSTMIAPVPSVRPCGRTLPVVGTPVHQPPPLPPPEAAAPPPPPHDPAREVPAAEPDATAGPGSGAEAPGATRAGNDGHAYGSEGGADRLEPAVELRAQPEGQQVGEPAFLESGLRLAKHAFEELL